MKIPSNMKAILKKAGHPSAETIRMAVTFKDVNDEKKIAIGEVYAPYVIDTHGDMMEPDDVELLAHRFMQMMLNDHIDIMHNNKPANAVAVESFIARDMPQYNEGAWVLGIKVNDPDLWDEIKSGQYGGYSVEMRVRKQKVMVEMSVQGQVFGVTEQTDGHDHVFFAKVDDEGKVVGGVTSKDNGHSHVITYGTKTDEHDDHSHRFFLP